MKAPRLLIFLSGLMILTTLFYAFKAQAHSDHTAVSEKEIEKHRQLDFGFKGFEQVNQDLRKTFETFDNSVNAYPIRPYWEPALQSSTAHLYGQWSPVYDWPLVAIHTMLLPNGKVLAWDSVNDLPTENNQVHDFTRVVIWDPATNLVTRVDNTTGFNLFCAGHASLPDGTPFIAGGNLNAQLQGTVTTHLFDYLNNTWTRTADMTQGGRWYPAVTGLANGEMLITSGGPATPEVRATNGTLRTLSNATLSLPLYPWLHAAPNGRAFYFGPDDNLRYLDTAGTGAWQNIGARDGIYRDYGSYAMYEAGKILATGGGASTKRSVILDITSTTANPVVTNTADLANGRRQHNLTILPDGTVLATGGNYNGAGLIDLNTGVYAAELWNPVTGIWTTLSSMQKTRQYHSTAFLLPDGRVFSGGGGICGTCYQVGYLEKNIEIFTPPYLFKKDGSGQLAARPPITGAPTSVRYNSSFTITTPNAASIRQVSMIHIPSVTHSVNFDQRRIPLTFSLAGNNLEATSPNNANLAPPGVYMLFIIDDQGVPSVAKMVRLAPQIAAPQITNASAGNGNATLNWTAVSGATGYVIKDGTASGNYSNQLSVGNVTSSTVTGLTNGTTYYFVVTAINGSQTSLNSNEVSATPTSVTAGTGTGLTGQYFDNSDFTAPKITRTDGTINFDWGYGSPDASIGVDTFSARWTGQVQPQYSQAYTFYTTSDDGIRLWVNNQLIINNWTDHAPIENSGTMTLTAGQKYDLKLEFYENGGGAVSKLSWSSASQIKQIIPQLQLYRGKKSQQR